MTILRDGEKLNSSTSSKRDVWASRSNALSAAEECIVKHIPSSITCWLPTVPAVSKDALRT